MLFRPASTACRRSAGKSGAFSLSASPKLSYTPITPKPRVYPSRKAFSSQEVAFGSVLIMAILFLDNNKTCTLDKTKLEYSNISLSKKTMNEKLIKKKAKTVANLMKSIAHEARLLILCDLVLGEKTVGDLQKDSLLSQSAFSQHLAILRQKKLVRCRKEGLYSYYSIANPDVKRLLAVLYEIYCQKKETNHE